MIVVGSGAPAHTCTLPIVKSIEKCLMVGAFFKRIINERNVFNKLFYMQTVF